MKKLGFLAAALLFSAGMAFLFPNVSFSDSSSGLDSMDLSYDSVFSQEVVGVYNTPAEITYIYESGKLLGAVKDYSKIEQFLEDLYHQEYEEDYPGTRLGLGEDVYISKELSLYDYEDIDDKIIHFLKTSKSYGIVVNAVEFSDSNGVYDTIYVKNLDDFYRARDKFLLFFCTEDTLTHVRNNQKIPELTTYGSREISVKIQETMSVYESVAKPDQILQNEQEILSYLSYGENQEKEYYVTIEGDTVDGVGTKTGLTGTQVMILNNEILLSTTQLLEPGTQLNVRYLEPIIDVEVQVELIRKEEIYPGETEIILDQTIKEGEYETVQEAQNGYKNVKYIETYINGQYVSYYLDSEQVTQLPVNEIIRQGTMIIPGVGTGTFRWPTDNPRITCTVGCYAGHRAVDIINVYQRYGNVYASDRGVVEKTGYNNISGYYIIINHNNGFKSYYGHLNKPAFVSVGENVNFGEVIGQIGRTGVATGPHIHFYILKSDGTRPHPCRYLGCKY